MKLVIELEHAFSHTKTEIDNVADYWFDDGFLRVVHERGSVWIPETRIQRLDETHD